MRLPRSSKCGQIARNFCMSVLISFTRKNLGNLRHFVKFIYLRRLSSTVSPQPLRFRPAAGLDVRPENNSITFLPMTRSHIPWKDQLIPLLIAGTLGPWLFRHAGIDVTAEPHIPHFVIVVCYFLGAATLARLIVQKALRCNGRLPERPRAESKEIHNHHDPGTTSQ